MFEPEIFNLDFAFSIFKVYSTLLFLNERLRFEHVEKLFDVHACFVNLSEKCAQVEQRSGKLQEKRLNKNKISRCQSTSVNIGCSHKKIKS